MSTELPKLDQVMEAAKKLPRATGRTYPAAQRIVVNTDRAFADDLANFMDPQREPGRSATHSTWFVQCAYDIQVGDTKVSRVTLLTLSPAATERAIREWVASRGEAIAFTCMGTGCDPLSESQPCPVHGRGGVQ